MRRLSRVPLFLLAALILGTPHPAVAQPVAGASVREEADSFLQRARSSFDAGDLQEASDLLAPALEIAPDYSEALYLRARMELAHRRTTLAAVADLQRALAGDSWTVTAPREAQRTLAAISLRTGRLADARAVLVKLVARYPEDKQTTILLARLYARDGEGMALRRTLADARAKFPLDDDLALLSADVLEKQGRRSAARAIIASQLDAHPDSPALGLRAASLAPTPAAQVADLRQYANLGGKDPLADALALEASARDAQKHLSRFIDDAGLARQDLVARVSAAVRDSGSVSATLRTELSRYTGNRDFDPDGEGYVERWSFQHGVPVAWVRDPSRDGMPDYEAQFSAGTPTSLTVRTGGRLLTLGYGPYPFVQSVAEPASKGTTARTWLLDPFTVTFPFLPARATTAGSMPRALENPGRPSLARMLQSAYREQDYAPDGVTVIRRIDLDRGRPIFLQEDTLGTGSFDHRVWYVNGEPVRGARDLDGTDRFLVSETWRGGRLAAIAVDTRGDGKVSYRERYVPSPMKSWDYDEDGIDDSREYPRGPDTIVREFSTAMNGVFDVSFVWKKNDLVSVMRRGQSVPVTHDAARGVVWIGPPAPPGVAIDAAGPEGYRPAAGKMYLVFRREGVPYAEEIR